MTFAPATSKKEQHYREAVIYTYAFHNGIYIDQEIEEHFINSHINHI